MTDPVPCPTCGMQWLPCTCPRLLDTSYHDRRLKRRLRNPIFRLRFMWAKWRLR